jgi:mannose-1-phosphate guanylyltransferase / mannose-6-phosphate isomerase
MVKSNTPLPQRIIPLVLCGGSGTRLWPLSRWYKPKQFLRILGKRSMIESTLLRCQKNVFDPRPIIVCGREHEKLLKDTIADLGIDADVILEPERRDSCAAVVAGAFVAVRRDLNALVMVIAADHDIPDSDAFAAAAKTAAQTAARGQIVSFGIKPTRPDTGYGYILPSLARDDFSVRKILDFVEKPNKEKAEQYISEGYLWNSGNFLVSANSLLEESAQLAPKTHAAVSRAVVLADQLDTGLLLNADAFAQAPLISFDHAIMEKSPHSVVLPVGYAWSDVGSWDGVAVLAPKNADGNSSIGQVVVEASHNVFVHSENMLTMVIGCSDISVISTPDAVLIVQKGQSEKIKSLIDLMKVNGCSDHTKNVNLDILRRAIAPILAQ